MSRRGPLRWLGALLGAVALLRLLGRRHSSEAPAPAAPPGPDPRAEELRRRLAESRAVVAERDEFEAAETTVDEADAGPADPADRRREVHEDARAALDEMRGRSGEAP